MSSDSGNISSGSHTHALAGVWQRVAEEDPVGNAAGADRDTLVLWTQTPESGMYVDLRLPKSSPGRLACCEPRPSALAATGISDKAKELLKQDDVPYFHALLLQKSFAGVLHSQLGDTTDSGAALEGDALLKRLADQAAGDEAAQLYGALPLCTCFWHRAMDYQPPAGLDIGVCASQIPFADGSVMLRETGDDASYAEDWLRLAGTEKGPFMALELQSEQNHSGDAISRPGFWVRTGRRFAYAVGYPATVADARMLQVPDASAKIKDCKNQSLSDALRSLLGDGCYADKDAVLDVLGSYVAVTGEIVSSDGTSDSEARWKIQYSTHPELIGCQLFGSDESSCSKLAKHGDDYGIVEQCIFAEDGSVVKRIWKVIELSGCDMPFS